LKKLSPLSISVGKKIIDIRKQKSLSLSQASELTGVSKAMLGQIERFESSPTVELLWKLSQGFDVKYTELLALAPDETTIEQADKKENKMLVKPVIRSKDSSKIEIFDIYLNSGFDVIREPHEDVFEEYVWVISGDMEVFYDNSWHRLQKGESSSFIADQVHGYRSLTTTARFSNTLVYK
jgi:transcriptional regulator with XRE-family HTH domain